MISEITHDDLYRITAKLSKTCSLDEIHQQCSEFCKLTGFDFFSYRATIPTTLTRPDIIEVSNYPEKWQLFYREIELIKIDPTLIHAETRHTPVLWDEIVLKRCNEKNTRYFFRKAQQHGLNNGISFPLRGNIGSTAVLNFASEEIAPLSQAMVDIILPFGSLFATYVNDATLRIFDAEQLFTREKRLSPRERECLLWVAEGKTAWEISRILKIGERTVSHHLESIISKLGVKNRPQAVARGLTLRYVTHRVDWESPVFEENHLRSL